MRNEASENCRLRGLTAHGMQRDRGGASRRDSQRGQLFFLPRRQEPRQIGAFGNGRALWCLPSGPDPRRHDDDELDDAQGTHLLRLSRGSGGTAAARTCKRQDVRGLSRLAQQQSENAAAEIERLGKFRSPELESLPRYAQNYNRCS